MLYYNDYMFCGILAYVPFDPMLCHEPFTFSDQKKGVLDLWALITRQVPADTCASTTSEIKPV